MTAADSESQFSGPKEPNARPSSSQLCGPLRKMDPKEKPIVAEAMELGSRTASFCSALQVLKSEGVKVRLYVAVDSRSSRP